MSFDSMLNHRAVLYRPTAGGVDANGDPTAGFSQPTTPSGTNARPDQSWSGLLVNTPLGEQQANTKIWHLHRGFTDIHERDILDIVEGPEAPARYRVLSRSFVTNGVGVVHHVEVATHVYTGAIS